MDLMVHDFIVDIETKHAPKKYIEAAQAEIERGSIDPRLKDPQKIEAAEEKLNRDYQKALQRVKDKSACLNAAPIGCIGLAADSNLLHWSCFGFSASEKAKIENDEGVELRTFESEKDMMSDFSNYLNSHYTEYSRIVGFNSKKFDFPKIRLACRRNGVKIPDILTSKYYENQIDLMKGFVRDFNCEDSHRLFISLRQVCLEFGVEYHKTLQGAEIPDAIERGDYETVTIDCLSDVIETYQVLLKMYG